MHLFQNQTVKLLTVCLCFVLFGISCKQSGSDKNEDPKIAKLVLPPGFHAEHLYSPTDNDQGSWVAMTFDDKGRMIASDQYGYLYRITIPPVGYDTATTKVKVEKLDVKMPGDTSKARVKIGLAHGLLYAFNSLYVTVNDEGQPDTVTRRSGLYRVQDTNGDDQFDKITLLKPFKGRGEHGPHNAVLSPDKKSIYVIAGNFTDLPQMDNYRSPNIWKYDNLLPLLLDPNGFGNNQPPPGGWIAKTDSIGSNWELISAGYRNPFDMAFNEDGELFTYDSDMEWDMGLPWYRPTRICHVTSGSEYGYRENDQKWSPVYPDNLPAVLNVGPGSPTNVMSGMNARFPEKYRRGIFSFDWTFGIIYHIQLDPVGSSYKAKAEEFISGSPLPLTDGAIGPDGDFYFLTGGRKIESDLYRIYYGDNKLNNDALASNESSDVKEARKVRHQLESFQKKPDTSAITISWPYLKSSDRFIRYAARIAVEHQPVSQWQDKALMEKDPVTLTQAMLALARHGNSNMKSRILKALMSVNYADLNTSQQLDLLRALEVTLFRMGLPDAAQNSNLIAYLDAKYPADNNESNRLLSKTLAFIGDPQVVSKTLTLMGTAKDNDTTQKTYNQSSNVIFRNPRYGLDIANMLASAPPEQQIYLAVALCQVKDGWTDELRDKYFPYFNIFLGRKGGNSYIGYINEARKFALENVPKNQFAKYDSISGGKLLNEKGRKLASSEVYAKGPGRNWTMEETVPLFEKELSGRDFADGKAMFTAATCASCHKMNGEGGNVGPDLSQLGSRFTAKDILESIIKPSEEISDQYAATNFYLKDGSAVMGRLIKQDNDKYYVSSNPFAPDDLTEIPKNQVVSTKLSKVSIMLPGMINRLNEDELKDLMAYLMSGGDKNNKMFKPAQ